MGNILSPKPVKLFVGMLAALPEGLDRSTEILVGEYGKTDLESNVIPFGFTSYYKKEMGPSLLRKFLSFEELIQPDQIATIKCRTNTIEKDLTETLDANVQRPVNLDPGYLNPSRIVLATTKDFSHRIYLSHGIYAEVTLQHIRGRWQALPWTYPDYKSEAYYEFFSDMRKICMRQMAQQEESN